MVHECMFSYKAYIWMKNMIFQNAYFKVQLVLLLVYSNIVLVFSTILFFLRHPTFSFLVQILIAFCTYWQLDTIPLEIYVRFLFSLVLEITGVDILLSHSLLIDFKTPRNWIALSVATIFRFLFATTRWRGRSC